MVRGVNGLRGVGALQGGFGQPGPKRVLDWDEQKDRPLVQVIEIREGDLGTADTIDLMTKLVLKASHDPDFVMLAQSVVQGCNSKDYLGELNCIYQYVLRSGRYCHDPRGLEWIQHPWYTLQVRKAFDCDDASIALAALALAVGKGAGFRTIKADPQRPDEFSHIYALLGYQNAKGIFWLPADATQGLNTPLGWEPPRDKVFAVKDWIIADP